MRKRAKFSCWRDNPARQDDFSTTIRGLVRGLMVPAKPASPVDGTQIRGVNDPVKVRKWALQSTSMPTLHGRSLPNLRLTAEGGMRKCSAGACPPLGSGWGVVESGVPIRCAKPQLRPALHAEGGMRKCSAGACRPVGSGWGVVESGVPIRCAKPQLRLSTGETGRIVDRWPKAE